MVTGDFNAKVSNGQADKSRPIGNFGLDDGNSRSEMLIKYLKKKIYSTNTHKKTKNANEYFGAQTI